MHALQAPSKGKLILDDTCSKTLSERKTLVAGQGWFHVLISRNIENEIPCCKNRGTEGCHLKYQETSCTILASNS